MNQKFLRIMFMLMDKAKGAEEGAGSGKQSAPANDEIQKQIETLKEENKKLLEQIKATKKEEPNPEEKSLADKARIEREENEKKAKEVKEIEASLRFELQSKDWFKQNSALLPKNIEGIFSAADKENYSNSIQKSNAIKSGIIQEFFSVQSNLDLLTDSQKIALEDFKKLTKDIKENKAKEVYDMIFEPAFETLKKVKKAAEINKGLGTSSDAETAYRARMKEISAKHFLKGKK